MNNCSLYDKFREVQEAKEKTYNDRSSAFITEGLVATEITMLKDNSTKDAALVYNDKEGPDDVIVYTLKKDDVAKSDYFSHDGVNYLIYEDVKLNDKTISYRKQWASECNVSFNVGQTTILGCYKSSLRSHRDTEFSKNQVVMGDQRPVIIIKSNPAIKVGLHFKIEGRYWKVQDYDNITNRGITYIYIEQATNEVNDVATTPAPTGPHLYAMIEQELTTKEAYFSSTPRVNIVSRLPDKVIFVIPFGIEEVVISVKEENEENEIVISTTSYKVVMS